MTSPELIDIAKETETMIIPTAQTAQHGPHLPVCADILHVEETARRSINLLARDGVKVILGPRIPFAHTPLHLDFPGYVHLEPDTQAALLRDVMRSMIEQGFRRIFILKVGEGSTGPIANAVYWVAETHPNARLHVVDWFSIALNVGCRSSPEGVFDGHAGERETSSILAIAPELVRKQLLKKVSVDIARLEDETRISGGIAAIEARQALGIWCIKDYASEGYHGNPTLATTEFGEELLSEAASILANVIKTAANTK